MQLLRLKTISGKDSFILEACLRDDAFKAIALPFSKNNEIAALEYFINSAREKLIILGTVYIHYVRFMYDVYYNYDNIIYIYNSYDAYYNIWYLYLYILCIL